MTSRAATLARVRSRARTGKHPLGYEPCCGIRMQEPGPAMRGPCSPDSAVGTPETDVRT